MMNGLGVVLCMMVELNQAIEMKDREMNNESQPHQWSQGSGLSSRPAAQPYLK